MHSFPEQTTGDRSPRVVFFDSGVGGLVYLEAFAQRNPAVATDYIADTAFFPYGERDPREVEERVVACFSALPDDGKPDLAVLACNTASVVALARLRREVSYPVVGVVPAVKPAAARTRSGHLTILSTNRTANDPYTRDLVERFAQYYHVHAVGLPDLVDRAERAFCDESDLVQEIDRDVRPAIPGSVDTVVLACTHFVRYRRSFEQVFGERVAVVDSLDGVVRRIEYLLDRENGAPVDLPPPKGAAGYASGEGRTRFYSTVPLDASYPCLRNRYDLRSLRVPSV